MISDGRPGLTPNPGTCGPLVERSAKLRPLDVSASALLFLSNLSFAVIRMIHNNYVYKLIPILISPNIARLFLSLDLQRVKADIPQKDYILKKLKIKNKRSV